MPAFRWVAGDRRRRARDRGVHLSRAAGAGTPAGGSRSAGGGALIDSGIHYVHALRWWGGEVRRVFALRPPQTIVDMAGEDAVDLLAECEGA